MQTFWEGQQGLATGLAGARVSCRLARCARGIFLRVIVSLGLQAMMT